MNTQQKALALRSLGNFSVMVREAGDWYASVDAEIKDGAVLISPCVSEANPNKAICALFDEYAKSGKLVVLNEMLANRRVVRWNGFMWEDAP